MPYPLCAQGCRPRACSTADEPRPTRTRSRRSTRRRSDAPWHGRVRPLRRGARPGRGRQQRRPRARRRSARARRRSRATTATTCAPRSPPGTTAPARRRSTRTAGQLGTFGEQLRKYGRDARADVGGRLLRRRHAARPRLSRRRAGGRRRATARQPRRMKIGLVTPVHLPAARRREPARPLPVREPRGCAATTSGSSPAATACSARREGDVIRLGRRLLDARPTARSARSRSRRATSRQVRTMLDREQFDLLHFHEPFVPFLSLVVLRAVEQRQRGDLPRLRRLLARRTSSASRLLRRFARAAPRPDRGVSAAARHFIERYFPGDYKVIPNGVDLRALRSVPCRSRAGRTGRRTSCSSAGSSRARACSTCSRPTGILRKTGCDCRLLVVGGGPQEREARRYLATRKLGGVEFLGRVSDDERDALFKTADVYCSPATGPRVVRDRAARGDGRRHGDRVQRHPRLQGRRPARPRGAARAAAQAEALAGGTGAAAARPATAGAMARPASSAPRSSAGSGSPPRSTTTTAS